jgi:uncharacterized membrane protein YphA (DoxX/SURF4 family)
MIKTSFSRADAGLLLLRLGVGLSLAILFGIPKFKDASAYVHTGKWAFVDFNKTLGIPLAVAVAFYQTLNESLGAVLVAVGLFTRWAAASLALGFAAATFCSFKMHEASWLLAAYFFLGFASLFLIGPGSFSLDHLLRWRNRGRVN